MQLLNSKLYRRRNTTNYEDLEVFTQLPCLLGHPVSCLLGHLVSCLLGHPVSCLLGHPVSFCFFFTTRLYRIA